MIPQKKEPYILKYVDDKYKVDPKAQPPLPIDVEPDDDIPPEPKQNYLTDDSDSDLDVFVDPIKSWVPKPYNIN